MVITEEKLIQIVKESVDRVLQEGAWGDLKSKVKSGVDNFKTSFNNSVERGEWLNPEKIDNETLKTAYYRGWKLTPMENGAYECQTLMGSGAKMPENMWKPKELVQFISQAEGKQYKAYLNPKNTSYMGQKRDKQGRIDYVYGAFDQNFIIKPVAQA